MQNDTYHIILSMHDDGWRGLALRSRSSALNCLVDHLSSIVAVRSLVHSFVLLVCVFALYNFTDIKWFLE
jgi:hypothetical protein